MIPSAQTSMVPSSRISTGIPPPGNCLVSHDTDNFGAIQTITCLRFSVYNQAEGLRPTVRSIMPNAGFRMARQA